MRRLYVVPVALLNGQIKIGTQPKTMVLETPDRNGGTAPVRVADPAGGTEDVMVNTIDLFHPIIGSHGIDLPGGLRLHCTSFEHSEFCEDIFHSHPEVAILPHPTTDGNLPLKSHLGRLGYKFAQSHLDAMKSHTLLGITEADSVLEVFRKASAIHPLIKLRNVL